MVESRKVLVIGAWMAIAVPALAGAPPVPEPASATLFAVGAVTLGAAAAIRAWRSRDKR